MLTDDQRIMLAGAREELDGAHRANAGHSAAWVAEADLRATRGSVPEAEEALRTALALDATDLRAWLNLADLQRATGRDDLHTHARNADQQCPRPESLLGDSATGGFSVEKASGKG
jgi:predicted Zn-dependent protease